MLHEAVNQEFTPKVQVITNESINFKLHKPDSIEFVSAELEKDELIVKYMAHQPRVEGEYACLQIYKNEELLTPYLCKYRDQELGTLVTEKILVPEGISTGDVVYLSNLILRNMESNKITLK